MAVTTHAVLVAYLIICGSISFYSTVATQRPPSGSRASTTSRQGAATTAPDISGGYEGYIPTTPHPDNVNCHIDVPTLTTMGGRCVRFGHSRMWSCQSGIHMQMSEQCDRRSRRFDQNRRRTRSHRSQTGTRNTSN